MRRVLTALLALLWCAPLHAQTPEDVTRSKELFRAGASAYAAGDYLAAIQALETAYELTPLPAIGFSLAQAERKQFLARGGTPHLERAVALFRRYLDEAPSGNRRGDAHDALNQLTPLLPRTGSVVEAKPTAPLARPTRLMIIAETEGALISLDGEPGAPSPLVREVSPGKHRVKASAPGFSPVEREVTAVASELVLSELRQSELPSALWIYTPSGADVYVDGVFAAQSPGRVTLELPAGEHRIAVSAKGRRAGYQRVRLVRGESLSLRISPELSTQRIVSLSLLCAGGAAIGAGIVLSGFAVRSENNAESFLGQSAHHNVSNASLIGYQASLSDRDRYRWASAANFVGAAGFLITGLFLHELDRPTPHDTPSTTEAPKTPTAKHTRPALALAPFTTNALAGATVTLAF